MKIFISYGHNDHTMLVDRLFDSLISNGHEPWKDDRYERESGIRVGDPFTQVIYDAIDASDMVIAILSHKTVENSPYCVEEREYAFSHKGTRFVQIIVEDVRVTLGNSLSYIDMRGVEDGRGGWNEALFQHGLRLLFEALRDPQSFAVGRFKPFGKIALHLKVTGVDEYMQWMTKSEEEFVGREWLREQCRQWVTDETVRHRVFVIFGEAGTGKSAFVRRLASDRELVRAVHVCIYDKLCTRRVKDVVKDLAYVLAQNNEPYAAALREKPLETVGELTADGLFEFLLVDPLRAEQEKFLLIIDGLDELDDTEGFEPLVRLLRHSADRLNPNVSLLLTTRPDEKIVDALRTVGGGAPLRQQVTLDADANRADLEEYIHKKLATCGADSELLAAQLLDASDGNFEYLTLFFKEVQEDCLHPRAGMTLPRGLDERYAHYLGRRFGEGTPFNRLQKRMLAVLCAAYEPLPIRLLAQVLGEDEYDVEDALREFRSLIRLSYSAEGELTAALFTKGFRDFLLDGGYGGYRIDRRRGQSELAVYVLAHGRTERALAAVPYWHRHAFTHLLCCAADLGDGLDEFMQGWLRADREQTVARLADALCSSEGAAIRAFCERPFGVRGEVIGYLKAHRETDTLSALADLLQETDASEAWILQGDLLLFDPTPENRQEASARFQKALALHEENVAQNPCYVSRRSLGITYERLGGFAAAEGTPQGRADAKRWFLKELALLEENLAQNPCYESRRSLGVVYNRLGDLAAAEGTPQGRADAKQWFLKKLALDEENFAQNPCYDSRLGLGITYNRLGDLAAAEGTPQGRADAKQWFLKELALLEENFAQNPCYESRRSLGIVYERLGGLAAAEDTPQGRADAKRWFLKKLALDEENVAQNPCYDSRRSLGITYDRLGRLAAAEGTAQGRADAKQWFLKMLPLDEENVAQNPCKQSKNDLRADYASLYRLCKAEGTPEGDAEAEEWRKKYVAVL